MVMDDDEALLSLSKKMLERLGYKVTLANEGSVAVSEYKRLLETDDAIDLIIMDLTVPGGMGGKDTIPKILAINPEAKVVVSSGYSNDKVMANFKEFGFIAAIAKPFDLLELSIVLSSVFSV